MHKVCIFIGKVGITDPLCRDSSRQNSLFFGCRYTQLMRMLHDPSRLPAPSIIHIKSKKRMK